MSGLIYNMNIPILRMYEGYPWRDSWIGSWFTRRHMAKFDAAQLRIDAMRAALRAMDVAVKKKRSDFLQEVVNNLGALIPDRRQNDGVKGEWLQLWHDSHEGSEVDDAVAQWRMVDGSLRGQYSGYRVNVKHAYPDRRDLILPTRLGNVIRSFEYYSNREYGIDSIEIWPRLVAVIPKDYAVSIDDTKTTFDFMMNCSLLSIMLSFTILVTGLLYPAPLFSITPAIYWIIKIVSLVLLSYFFYLISINRADAWGLLVKSAIDLYRWDLLKKLGYKQDPKQRKDERELWGEISRQIIYGDRFDKKILSYADEQPSSFPSAWSASATAALEITRGIKPGSESDVITVYLRVRNKDADVAAAGVVVSDKLSDDLDFEWDSAKVGTEEIPMSGTNPYQFQIGDLQKDSEKILTYNAILRKRRKVAVSVT